MNLLFGLDYLSHLLENYYKKQQVSSPPEIIPTILDLFYQMSQNSFLKYLGFNTEEKNKELGELLQGIYNDERDLYNTVYKMAESMNAAIEDVTEALCLNGMMHSSKVPEAALKLNEYRTIFKELETSAAKTEDNLNEIVQELN